jgi:CDP-glucose 4,6-dehydratase
VFVTGGGGYLGLEIVRAITQAGAAVTVFDQSDCRSRLPDSTRLVRGSILEPALREILRIADPQTCLHLAGLPGVEASQRDPVAAFEINARGVWLLLDVCRQLTALSEVVCVSSNHVYGEQPSRPTDESAPLLGHSAYAVSKIGGDYAARAFGALGVPVAVARITNTFGADDPHAEHLVTGSIRAVLAGRRPVIRGGGRDTKGYLYYRDTVDAIVMLAEQIVEKKLYGQAFNFAPEAPMTTLDVVRAITRELGRPDLEPIVRGAPDGTFEREHLSIARARTILGWAPRWTFAEAIREAARELAAAPRPARMEADSGVPGARERQESA